MEQQQTGKRSIALPITLVLLVFSLIGNVFLYSQFLQHKQENNYETGKQIFEEASQTKQYFEQVIPELEALLQIEQPEARLDVKFRAGAAIRYGEAVVDLTAEAQRITGQKELFNPELTQAFVTKVEKSLMTIGSHSGPLTEEERVYLLTLKESFESMSGIMSGFNMNIADNRIALIRLSSGLDWTELVEQLLPVMNDLAAKLPAS